MSNKLRVEDSERKHRSGHIRVSLIMLNNGIWGKLNYLSFLRFKVDSLTLWVLVVILFFYFESIQMIDYVRSPYFTKNNCHERLSNNHFVIFFEVVKHFLNSFQIMPGRATAQYLSILYKNIFSASKTYLKSFKTS